MRVPPFAGMWSAPATRPGIVEAEYVCSLAVGDVEPQSDNPLSVRGRLRVGDRGKDRASGVLQRAFAKGQLSKEELGQRLSVVFDARVRNDLRPALEDLEEYQLVRANPRLRA
jgi:hypothetical protein